jgi:Thiamine pyrophosphokinase C terminal
VSTLQVVALAVAGLFALGMALVAIGADDVLWSILRARWSDFVYWIRELFT